MRCLKKTCTLDALDGGNYCELHLKHKGASRPGISPARSASNGRFIETPGKVQSAEKAPRGKSDTKRATGNPMLLGKATALKTSASAPRADRERSPEVAKKVPRSR